VKSIRSLNALLFAALLWPLFQPAPAGAQTIPHPITTQVWTWKASGSSSPAELRFGADGVVASSAGPRWRWKSKSARSVAIESADGREAVLVFDEAFHNFDAVGFDGKTKATGARKLAPVLMAAPAPAAPTPTPKPGIAIAGIDQTRNSVLMATGGHSHELEDVNALLRGYGAPRADVEPHPEAVIYPGIPYLTPWRVAEGILVPDRTQMRTSGKIACAGFPDGLTWVAYSGKWSVLGHGYNRLYIVKDIVSQVVCIEFRHETQSWRQPDDWRQLDGNWRVLDYVNAEVKGQSDIRISTQVLDERQSCHRIVVHTTNPKIGRSATLFLPQPLIDLMLHCVQGRRAKKS
jgi:hypothetical protein